MELEKLDNLNLGKENFSQEDIEDILGGVTEYDNYGIPDISCAGGSGSCKESCRDGCKDTQKKGSQIGLWSFIIFLKKENQKVNVILVKKEILVDKARAYVGKQY